jgi:uncharacterized protein DUF4864
MRRVLVLAAALLAVAVMAPAAALAQTADPAIQETIRNQIEAFKLDDGTRAYSYAAPNIRAIFPTVDDFMTMVKRGYQPVYRPRSYNFGTQEQLSGSVRQSVDIVGPDGDYYTAVYSLERQPDGSWKITGCSLVKSEGSSA